MLTFLSALVAATVIPVGAVPAPLASSNSLDIRQTAPGFCAGNTPTTRSAWCDLGVETDYYNVVPDTGVTREYWLEVVNSTLAPDGIPRDVISFNGTVPGPTLIADWGDTIIVHVTNPLQNNGTTIHFHGIRQNLTNPQDGVPSLTQCPLAPGQSLTYTWRATEYGSTWYHSHFSLQAWEGAYGGIIINGPASANYDVDAGTLSLSDWTHRTVDSLYSCENTHCSPIFDTGLLNGTNTYGNGTNTTGSRFSMAVTEGLSYRIRLVNVAVETEFKFSIDGHTLTVISNDLVPIQPYDTDMIAINVGQRYDVIVTANQASQGSDFWMRAIPMLDFSKNANPDDIKGIFHYGDSTDDVQTPMTTAYNYTDASVDEDGSNLVPVVPWIAGNETYGDAEIVNGDYTGNNNLFTWYLNDTTFFSNWDDPTLLQVDENRAQFTNQSHAFFLPEANQWTYLLIESSYNTSHPVHLHGHDFLILGQGIGYYDPSNVTLNYNNPPRRDTATMPALGFLYIAFKSDNPGVWLLHCHIGWHAPQGFAMQIIERESEIPGLVSDQQHQVMQDTCTAWDQYMTDNDVVQADSGV